MNIHPIIVHFPIALLTLYVVFEILPLERWYPRAAWADIKAILVCFGGLGILAALLTGQLAESSLLAHASENVLHIHKTFAAASAAVFGIIALAYFIRWAFSKHIAFFKPLQENVPFIQAYSDIILTRWVVVTLALVGFIVLSLTGTLGAIIVYGPNGDFITQFVASLFRLQ
ncbi:MAG TPA: DUF2231 domain-containing protein [Candidatus Paceibacterota bacterium]